MARQRLRNKPAVVWKLSLASDSVSSISDKLFWELCGLKQGKANLLTHTEGSDNREDGNLFPCLNLFHPLLAHKWEWRIGLWPKGWSHTCPPHFLVGMLGRPMRSCLWSGLTGMCSCCPVDYASKIKNKTKQNSSLFSQFSQTIGNLCRFSHVLAFKSFCQHTLGNSFVVCVYMAKS